MDGSNLKIVIKEENRLAITVLMIDYEGHIVPRGYYYKLPDENIIKAPHFKGIHIIYNKFLSYFQYRIFIFIDRLKLFRNWR